MSSTPSATTSPAAHHQRHRGRRPSAVDATVDARCRGQVEQTAPSYNPVRIAGQVAGFAVRTAFSVTGAVVSTGGQVLAEAARKVTGRR